MTDFVNGIDAIRLGLRLKRLASNLLLIGMPLSLLTFNLYGVLSIAAFIMAVDLAGRVLCLKGSVADPGSIRWSVAAQATGLVLLLVSALFGNVWIMSGLAAAIVFQIAAARFFVTHLAGLAQAIGRPDLSGKLDELRGRLNVFAGSLYGAGFSSLLIGIAAAFVGLMSWGIGWLISVPIGGMAIVLIMLTSLAAYLRMLVTYREVIRSIEDAVNAIETQTE